jgi:hypothetical protein
MNKSEIEAKVNAKIADENFIKKCVSVNICPRCGKNLNNTITEFAVWSYCECGFEYVEI